MVTDIYMENANVMFECTKRRAFRLFFFQLLLDIVWYAAFFGVLWLSIDILSNENKGIMYNAIIVALILSLLIMICLLSFCNYCFVKHYQWDKDTSLCIDLNNQEFKYHSNRCCRVFRSEDVVEYHVCNEVGYMQIHMFNWTCLSLKDGSKVYLTNFLDVHRWLDKNCEKLGLPKYTYSNNSFEGILPI